MSLIHNYVYIPLVIVFSCTGFKSCVFSFSSNGHSDPLYAKAIEER